MGRILISCRNHQLLLQKKSMLGGSKTFKKKLFITSGSDQVVVFAMLARIYQSSLYGYRWTVFRAITTFAQNRNLQIESGSDSAKQMSIEG